MYHDRVSEVYEILCVYGRDVVVYGKVSIQIHYGVTKGWGVFLLWVCKQTPQSQFITPKLSSKCALFIKYHPKSLRRT